jgi:glucose-6-phosphate 1-dehydrogenase
MKILPTAIVIFGGAGDLTWRKLIPSLYDLYLDGRMPAKFAIIAVDRAPASDSQLHKRLLAGVNQFSRKGKAKQTEWHAFVRHVFYQEGDFKDPATYSKLEQRCSKLDKDWKVSANRISTSPPRPP